MMVVLNKQQESTIKETKINSLYKFHSDSSHDSNYRYNSGHTNKDGDNKIPLGVILGSTFAVIIFLSFAIVVCFLIARRKRKKEGQSGWTKEIGDTTEDNDSLNDTTSSLVVEYVDQPNRDNEEQRVHDYDDNVVNNNSSSHQSSTASTPNQDGSDRELLSQHTASLQISSPSGSPQPMSRDLASQSSQPHPTVTIISPPQPTDTPRESSETASGSFDRPSWNRNSRFQEFF